ncbi:MAG: hypothetical protein KAX70_00540 [Pseudomonas sp.]|nr:hypothetical protein [Pseudomonas sp.]
MSVVKRPRTYRSVIGTCADALRRWRAGTGYTRETMAVMLFEQHRALGLDRVSGLSFAVNPDAGREAKIAGDRLGRWLDDDRDNGLLPANMLPSLLATLPEDIRVAAAAEILAPAGLTATLVPGLGALGRYAVTCAVVKECGEGMSAIVSLPPDAAADDIRAAIGELNEAVAANMQAIHQLEAELLRRAPAVVPHGGLS